MEMGRHAVGELLRPPLEGVVGVFGDGQAVDFHADQAVVLIVEVVGVRAVGYDVAGGVVGIARARGGVVGRNRPEGVDGSQAVGGVGRVGLARAGNRWAQKAAPTLFGWKKIYYFIHEKKMNRHFHPCQS